MQAAQVSIQKGPQPAAAARPGAGLAAWLGGSKGCQVRPLPLLLQLLLQLPPLPPISASAVATGPAAPRLLPPLLLPLLAWHHRRCCAEDLFRA
jgi:hypothetical protein